MLAKIYQAYCHTPIPDKAGSDTATCLICDEPMVADREWLCWITVDEMNKKLERKSNFMRGIG